MSLSNQILHLISQLIHRLSSLCLSLVYTCCRMIAYTFEIKNKLNSHESVYENLTGDIGAYAFSVFNSLT